MKLPISFEDFKKNPIAAIAFVAILAMGYMYVDKENVYKDLINKKDERIAQLNKEVKRLNDYIIDILK